MKLFSFYFFYKYLVLKRLPKSGEKRLLDAYTFGVGGHINPVDSGENIKGRDVIERGMHREMAEEIAVKSLKSIKLVGFLYDDSIEVSRHHIGFVYDAELESSKIEIMEKEALQPYFVDKKNLPNYLNGKETWAEIIYKDYISKQKSPQKQKQPA